MNSSAVRPRDGPENWACTLDNLTGLMWEMKAAGGLRGKDNTYSWNNPNAAVNGGAPGTQNGGKCQGSSCDTKAYVQAVNELKLCGAGDWRLPTRKELLSIVNNGRLNPAIDIGFFPNTPAAYFWTASPYADQANLAWSVFFRYGEVYPVEKSQANQVRLVREVQ